MPSGKDTSAYSTQEQLRSTQAALQQKTKKRVVSMARIGARALRAALVLLRLLCLSFLKN
jgi:hypothetical protein